jgi:transposase InsO family protein
VSLVGGDPGVPMSHRETFGFVRDLILRLKNERHGDVVQAIRSDNGSEFKKSHFKTFYRDLGLEH